MFLIAQSSPEASPFLWGEASPFLEVDLWDDYNQGGGAKSWGKCVKKLDLLDDYNHSGGGES